MCTLRTLFFPVGQGCHTTAVAENLGKIGTAVKAGLHGHFGDGQIRFSKQLLCRTDPVSYEIIQGRLLDAGLKTPQALPGTDRSSVSDLLQGDPLGEVFMDLREHT